MEPLDAAWHLFNFVAPALAVALLSTLLAKLAWRRELAAVPWQRLAAWSALAGAATLIGGLWVFGRDGMMATYGSLAAASALALWWAGFARR